MRKKKEKLKISMAITQHTNSQFFDIKTIADSRALKAEWQRIYREYKKYEKAPHWHAVRKVTESGMWTHEIEYKFY